MQGMTGRLRNPLRAKGHRRDEGSRLRHDLRLGIIGVLALVIALAAVAVLYVVPFGKHTYTAELSEAQSVRTGDDVRLAGISVGSVKSLRLHPDRVEMTFTVDSSVFVGADTTLDVRMLTIAGGHYVALFPAGSRPLGGRPIPAERVRLPYSLVQTFQDATEPLRRIDGKTVHDNFSALASSVESSPDALRRTLDGIARFADAVDRQRADISKAIDVADEYLGAVNTAKGELGRLVQQIGLLENILSDKRSEVRTAVETLDRIVSRLAGLQPSWQSTLRPLAEHLVALEPELDKLGERLQPVIDGVHALTQQLTRLMPNGGEVVVTAPAGTGVSPDAVCVPVPGRSC